MSEFYKSECGEYLCRCLGGGGLYEVWTVDGCIHWRNDNRIKTWADQEKFNHPMAYSVGGFSAETIGQKKGSFTLTLLHCDTSKVVEPFKGNTILESLKIVFRRQVPRQQVPKWLKESN
jgi:hypothetical protein